MRLIYFIIDHISYNSSALTPLIAERKKYKQFLIRRDPRYLSHIYVLEPHSNRYLEVPYRTLSRPTITLWEHRQAIHWLNQRDIYRMNETLIFQAIDRMRELIKDASQKTKSARRQQAKTNQHLKSSSIKKPSALAENIIHSTHSEQTKETEIKIIKPFDDIEIW